MKIAVVGGGSTYTPELADGTSEQQALALDKAMAVFRAAGIDPLRAFIALRQRET